MSVSAMFKLGPQSLARLRWSLLLFALLAGGGGGAALASREFAARAAQAHRQAQAQREEMRARLAHADRDAAEIRRRIGRYRDMQAGGLVGPERRLDWVEHIAQVGRARGLIDLRYELAPQQPAASASEAGGLRFMASAMSVQLRLLHEQDLLGFLADLGSGVPALVRVRRCNVERIKPGAQPDGATLKAECAIDWITLREAA